MPYAGPRTIAGILDREILIRGIAKAVKPGLERTVR